MPAYPRRSALSPRWLSPLYLAVLLVAFSGCGDDGPGPLSYGFGFVVWIVASIAVGTTAKRWGRDEGSFLVLSFFFSPLLAGLILLIKGQAGTPCVRCAEKIKPGAMVCWRCGAPVAPTMPYQPPAPAPPVYGPPSPAYGPPAAPPSGWGTPAAPPAPMPATSPPAVAAARRRRTMLVIGLGAAGVLVIVLLLIAAVVAAIPDAPDAPRHSPAKGKPVPPRTHR